METAMEHITIGEFEKKLRNVFVRVADDQEPISVVMDEGREVILVDGDEYRSVMETFYLLRSPANAERLRQGIQQHKEGKTKTVDVETYLD
jgi:antitoxin YefM